MVVRRKLVIETIAGITEELAKMIELSKSEGTTEEWVDMGPFDNALKKVRKICNDSYNK